MPLTFPSKTKQTNLCYLKEAARFFKDRKESGFAGLTNQTFLVCIQAMSAEPDQAQSLHEQF